MKTTTTIEHFQITSSNRASFTATATLTQRGLTTNGNGAICRHYYFLFKRRKDHGRNEVFLYQQFFVLPSGKGIMVVNTRDKRSMCVFASSRRAGGGQKDKGDEKLTAYSFRFCVKTVLNDYGTTVGKCRYDSECLRKCRSRRACFAHNTTEYRIHGDCKR
jgi:MoaA/NifB/PqqE/SkfB family radical SAM enzyme